MADHVYDDTEEFEKEKELNKRLKKFMETVGWKEPWTGDFDEFMKDKNNKLDFSK